MIKKIKNTKKKKKKRKEKRKEFNYLYKGKIELYQSIFYFCSSKSEAVHDDRCFYLRWSAV